MAYKDEEEILKDFSTLTKLNDPSLKDDDNFEDLLKIFNKPLLDLLLGDELYDLDIHDAKCQPTETHFDMEPTLDFLDLNMNVLNDEMNIDFDTFEDPNLEYLLQETSDFNDVSQLLNNNGNEFETAINENALKEMFPNILNERNQRRRPLLFENNNHGQPIVQENRNKIKIHSHRPRADALMNHDYSKRRLDEERYFACPLTNCEKIYAKASHLKAHIRRHSGEKPFACNWMNCNWKFSRSDELARHKRSHSGIKPYKCEMCDKSFARSDHLSKHNKVHSRIMAQYGTYSIKKKIRCAKMQ